MNFYVVWATYIQIANTKTKNNCKCNLFKIQIMYHITRTSGAIEPLDKLFLFTLNQKLNPHVSP